MVAIVEDEDLVRDLAVCELEDRGLRVVEFATADAALPWLRAHGDELAMMVTDVQMPGALNGLQLADIVCELWPALSILVTSGGPLVNPSKLPPSACFVAKPWRPADLAARVHRAVTR